MTLVELLSTLRTIDITVWAEQGQLCYSAPPGALTAGLRAELVAHKGELIALLSRVSARADAPVVAARARQYSAPLSFAQQRLWLLDQLEPGSATYNIPAAVRFAGPLDVIALERCLNEVVRRHEALRTTFRTEDEQPVQVVEPFKPRRLAVLDLRALPPADREDRAARLVDEEARRPFDLVHGPLLRMSLLRLDEHEHVLLLTLHHIVADGWSLGVLVREVAALYEALSAGRTAALPELPIQYADFAVWQREQIEGPGVGGQGSGTGSQESGVRSQESDVDKGQTQNSKRPEGTRTQNSPLEAHLAYWRQQLAGIPPVLDLPLDHPRLPVRTFRSEQRIVRLAKDLSNGLRALSQREQATLFMTLLAALDVVLQRYSGQADIVVGSPIAGRSRRDLEGLIGCFLNTLVLRTDLSGNPSFRELLRRVRAVCLQAYAHQDVPFEKLLEELQPERDLSYTPLFQIFLNMINLPDIQLDLPGLTSTLLATTDIGAKFDITLYVREQGEELELHLVYNADLFTPARMAELLEQLRQLLAQIVARPDAAIAQFSLLTAAAQARLPDPRAALDARWQGAVHTRFSEWAQRAPDRLALVDGREAWTYAELDRWSSQLARHLLAQGIRPQDAVAIYAHRSAALVWAILGVLKAGAAFMILDPAHPAARLVEYLGMARPRAWLQIAAAGALPDALEAALAALAPCCRLTLPGRAAELLAGYPAAAPVVAVGPDDLACITFTSGSTGQPKGIMGRHGPLTHFLPWQSQTFGLSESDRFSMLSGLAHDPLQRDIFTPLWLGATLCIPSPDVIGTPGQLAEWMRLHAISVVHLTPALGQLLVKTTAGDATELPALRYAFIVGDVLTKRDVARIRTLAPAITCVNFYGSTETQRAVGYYVVPNDEAPAEGNGPSERAAEILPLGQGMKDVQLLVLNAAGQLAGIGEVGEICVRSPHLARGYLGDEALTRERFILNPFAEDKETRKQGDKETGDATPNTQHPTPNTRLYKTGDLGRYLPDGTVVFCGRADQQVKIRGFRVELGEIEAVLGQHPSVREAVVVTREDVPGDKRLVAYVVPKIEDRGLKIEDSGSDAPDPLSSILYPLSSELRYFLKDKLPDYMVPSAFVVLEALPLTPNGKVDRGALPAPAPAPAPALDSAPRTPTEELLAAIWAAVLHHDHIDVDANFFELGGHSLLATQVVARLRDTFQVELPLRALFEAPTLAGLAARVEAARSTIADEALLPIAPVGRDGPLPLAFAQQRLWFLDQLEPGSAAYTISCGLDVSGPLDVPALTRGLDQLIQRHEALRTTFVAPDGQPLQVIAPALRIGLPVLDLAALSALARDAAIRRIAPELAKQPFDLVHGPLIRGLLLRLAPQDHVMLLMLHHIIADGWSLNVLLQDLSAFYDAAVRGRPAALPPLPVQYADFAVWQRAWLLESGRQGDKETRRQGDKETDVDERSTQNSKLKTQNSPLEAQLAYWRAQLADQPGFELPTDRPRPRVPTFRGAPHRAMIPGMLLDALQALSRQEGVTLFMTLLATWQLLLARYSGQEDLSVGTPIANRTRAEIEGLIGCFANTLVMRTNLSGDPTFRGLLSHVREVALGAYAHQDLPFEHLVESLQLERDLSRGPLFQVLFILQNAPLSDWVLSELTLSFVPIVTETAKFDLTLSLLESDGGLHARWEYATDLFDATTIARMAGHFQTLLEGVVAGRELPISRLPLLSAAERAQILVAWNATCAPYPRESCLHDLLTAQATRTPDAIALVFDGPGVRGQGSGVRETSRQGDKETRGQGSGVRSQESEFLAPDTQHPTPNTQHPTPNTQQLTYRALDDWAAQVAGQLRALGVGPDVRVGICMERSPELVAGLLGVLKAGGAYIPLDPSYPPARLAWILEDAQVRVLLTTTDDRRPTTDDRPTTDQRSTTNDRRPPLHLITPSPRHPFTSSPLHLVTPSPHHPATLSQGAVSAANLAYVIYTSGSTGRPKGVQIPHSALVNFLTSMRRQPGMSAGDVLLAVTTVSFDIAALELFLPFSVGARLVLARREVAVDGQRLAALLEQSGATMLQATPATWRLLLEAGWAGCSRLTLLCGGEALPRDLAQQLLRRGAALWNMYGPTETTIWSSTDRVAEGDGAVTIGRPIANTQLYVLDRHWQPAPIGVPGELLIGGDGLARGYLNRPDLTAAAFIPNPFAGDKETRRQGDKETEDATPNTQHPTPITRLYRTGDLARYRPNGAIEYLGRGDHQVKVRGFRIELGEIENVLRQHPSVQQGVVVAREDAPGDRRLVAYVVPKIEDRGLKIEDSGLDAPEPLSSILYPLSSELRGFLQEKLPDYMLPAAFVVLEALPLTPNGKVDRRALPAPAAATAQNSAPHTPVEELLSGIWAAVLHQEHVSIDADFFALGGHSLLATRLMARLRDTFGVDLPLRTLFEAPTLSGLAAQIVAARHAGPDLPTPPIRPAAHDSGAPLSFAQQRLWFLDQLQPGSATYNVFAAVRLAGSLDLAALARSLDEIVRRHEVLRTTFAIQDGQPVQVIAPPRTTPIPTLDLATLPAPALDRTALGYASAEVRRPFDLARGPLFRSLLVRLGERSHALLLTMHHIVMDGWSIAVLFEELAALYAAFAAGQPSPLPDLPVRYADYAVWQRAWLQESGVRSQESGVRSQGATAPLPPPAGGGTEGSRSQEPDLGEHTTQNSKLKTQNSPLEAHLAYWSAQLAGAPPALELPSDRVRSAIQTTSGAQHTLALPATLRVALVALSRAEGVTLFMTLLAAWQLLLSRYSGQEDILVGVPISGRTRAEIEPLIGVFINTLVLRGDLSGNPPFRTLLRRVRAACLDAYAHQDLPFEQLVEALQPERDLSRTPLFQVLFIFQNTSLQRLTLPGLDVSPLEIAGGSAKFELTLQLTDSGSELAGSIEYNTDLFEAATIARMVGHFQTLLEGSVAHPERPLADLPLLTEDERRQLLVDWNAPDRGVRSQESGVRSAPTGSWCFPQLFAAQAARRPDAIALVFDARNGQYAPTNDQRPTTNDGTDTIYRVPMINDGEPRDSKNQEPATNDDPITQNSKFKTQNYAIPHPSPPPALRLSPGTQHLTYRELDDRADQLARYLRALDLGNEARVGIFLDRSLELLVGLLGTLKAGAAYVPLDPTYPLARLAFILEDAAPPVILTQERLRDRLPQHAAATLALDSGWPAIAGTCAEAPLPAVLPDQLAYVIYTSGSTGRPKGVQIAHRALVNVLCDLLLRIGLTERDGLLAITTLAFDIAALELYMPLLAGARVLLARREAVADGAHLGAQLNAAGVTAMQATPVTWQLLVQTGWAGSPHLTVLCGGEALPRDLADQLLNRSARVWNLYGPTETTIWSLIQQVGGGTGQVPIGWPLANTQVYLLDRHMNPVPIGVPGELCIGGDGMARGYLNRPDLTAERFIPNPFTRVTGDGCWVLEDSAPNTQHPTPNTRLYKTGDLARYLPDGEIEFLGRRDQQIKLRGFRIELGEIEAVLRQHPGVRDGVVSVQTVGSEPRLVAYVVPKIEDRGLKIEDSGSDAPDPLSSILYPLSSELRAFLQAQMPHYMVPSAFVLLEGLPLTPNGKIDRRALPRPSVARRAARDGARAPRTDLERKIAAIWQTVLDLDEVEVDDNFFDLGGSSFQLAQVQRQLRDALGLEVAVVDLFQYPTIAAMVNHLGQEQPEQASFNAVKDRIQKQRAILDRQKQLRSRS